MSLFANTDLPTSILLGTTEPTDKANYDCYRLYPFYGRISKATLRTNNGFKRYKNNDMFFTSTQDGNVIIKIGDVSNLAFSAYVPCQDMEIPIALYGFKDGKVVKENTKVFINKVIKLNVNTYVINPNHDEVILVTSETKKDSSPF